MEDAPRNDDAPMQSEKDAAFIAEHGRLMHPVSHPSFDPFRRSPSPPQPPLLLRVPLLFVLVPLRILIFLLVAPISWILVRVFGPPVNKKILHDYSVTHLPAWRRAICVFATRLLARTILLSLGFWRVHGTDHPNYDATQVRGATIVTNHVGVGDPCLLAYMFAPAFVAKMAVASIPFVGRVGAAQHSFYIDRHDAGARNTTAAIIERQKLAVEPDSNIPPVCIFPEGTTTNGRYMLRFRTGAFVAGTPVLPVLLRYPYRWFSPTLEAIRTPAYVWGLVSQPWNSVHYYRLPVYYPTAEERENPRLYADNVRNMMHEYSDFLEGEKRMHLCDSNFMDKAEYLALLRGDNLKPGLKLTM